jgi:F-type H+-transporting ATPase subunit gamma
MERDDLFLALVRAHLFASIYKASAEALATENAARLALMQQAEQSVDDRLDTLIADTRTVRQAEITTELLDVVIGFEALRKRKKPAATESDETERNNSDQRPERKTP